MKAAVSIPDEVFEEADRLARHAPDQVTEAMNQVCDHVGETFAEFGRRAARRVLEKNEW